MNTFINRAVVVCLFLQLNGISFAQVDNSLQTGIFKKGDWELNFSASIGNLTSSQTSTNIGTYGTFTNEKSTSLSYIQLGVIPAYFVTDGLSIEPEINVLIQSQEGVNNKPSLSFLANLAYNFSIPEKKFAPFIRVGYGISNSIPYPSVIGELVRVTDDLDVGVINAGAGLKFLISEHLLFRTEINFRRFAYTVENRYSGSKYSNDYKLTSISGIFGFSVLL